MPHVIVCPCLMKHLQRKEFIKDSDLPFTIPTSLSFYPNTFHETLCIALVFALIKRSNWKRSWAIQGIQISRAFLERPEGGFKVAVGSRPPVPPIMGRELRQMQKDPVRGEGGGGLFCANFCCVQGTFTPCLKSWCRICYRPTPWIGSQWGKLGARRLIEVWWSGGRRGKTFLRSNIRRSISGNTYLSCLRD